VFKVQGRGANPPAVQDKKSELVRFARQVASVAIETVAVAARLARKVAESVFKCHVTLNYGPLLHLWWKVVRLLRGRPAGMRRVSVVLSCNASREIP